MSLIVSLVSGKNIFFCIFFIIPLKWIFLWVTIITGRNKSNATIEMTLRYETWIQAYFLFDKKKKKNFNVDMQTNYFQLIQFHYLKKKKISLSVQNTKIENFQITILWQFCFHRVTQTYIFFYFIYFFFCWKRGFLNL